MLISGNNHRVQRNFNNQPKVNQAAEQGPKEVATLSFRENNTVRSVSADLMYVGGLAGSVGAGVYASNFMPSGMSGFSGALTGAVTGGLAGGATGFALAAGSQALWPSDNAGDGMMKGILTTAGAVMGVVGGGISGYFGAQPMLVAPATVVGGVATTLALGYARDAIINE